MSCVIYREGFGHFEHGEECEMTTCEPEDLQAHIDAGWLQNPPGYVPPDPVVEAETEEESPELTGEEVQELFDSLAEDHRVVTEERDRLAGEVQAISDELTAAKEAIDAKDNEIAGLTEELRVAKLPCESSDDEDDTEETEEEAATLDSVEVVRQKAKEAGIVGWDTKRVKTLRKELENR